MPDERKGRALTFLLLAAIAIAAIASTLPRLELRPGIPLPGQENSPGTAAIQPLPDVTISINAVVMAILGITLVLGLVYSLYRLLQGTSWKAILRSTLLFAAFVGIFLIIVFALAVLYALIGVQATLEPLQIESLPPVVAAAGPPLGPLPPILIWLVWAGLGTILVLLAIWLIRGNVRPTRDADALSLEAERALRALKTDADFKNAIIRCYWQMSLALQKEQGIQLEETMTAREFERLLEARGFPPLPVRQLTQLFEAARYRNREPGPADHQKAIDCLSAIVQHCRERRKPG
jgi:hypothetical protein